MLSLLAAFLAASQSPPPTAVAVLGRTSWIFSTVGHSEWCPAGNVRLDLRNGSYAFTATAPRRVCNAAGLERPVATGRLAADRLAAIRAAASRVLAEGFVSPPCREGGRLAAIVISNGGTPILLLTNGAATRSSPRDLSCWSEAANALHGLLDEAFGAHRRR